MNSSSTSLAVTQVVDSKVRGWLRSPRRLLALAVLAGIVALAFGWYSLGFAAIAPVFYLLPCAVMMAMCARGMGHNGDKASEAGSTCGAGKSTANEPEAKRR